MNKHACLQNKSKLKGLYVLENKSKEIWTAKKYRTQNINNNHWTLDKMQRADMVLQILGLFLPMSFVFINGKHFILETENNNEIKWDSVYLLN